MSDLPAQFKSILRSGPDSIPPLSTGIVFGRLEGGAPDIGFYAPCLSLSRRREEEGGDLWNFFSSRQMWTKRWNGEKKKLF